MSRFSLHRRGMELGVSWVGRPEELFPIDRVLVVIDVQLLERLLRIGRQKTEPEPGFVDGAHRSHGLYRHGALGKHDARCVGVQRTAVDADGGRRRRICRPAVAGVLMILE